MELVIKTADWVFYLKIIIKDMDFVGRCHIPVLPKDGPNPPPVLDNLGVIGGKYGVGH